MQFTRFLRRLAPACGALLVAAVLLPSESEAHYGLGSAGSSAAVASLSPAFLPLSLPPTAPLLGEDEGLPTSIMPHPEVQCSVNTAEDPGADCSVFESRGATCSAHCSTAQSCSAFANLAQAGEARCSTYGVNQTGCSVLPPPIPPSGTAFCSAVGFTGSEVSCSVQLPSVHRKQVCTSRNPGGSGDFCSASGAQQSMTLCSVLNSGMEKRSFCSVAFAGNKRCSSKSFTECSVAKNMKGICTALKGAAPNRCSTQGGGHCSVIEGHGRPGVCRQP